MPAFNAILNCMSYLYPSIIGSLYCLIANVVKDNLGVVDSAVDSTSGSEVVSVTYVLTGVDVDTSEGS